MRPPETAVDLQLGMTELGIKLGTPRGGRVRPLGGRAWRKVDGELYDLMAYAVCVPSGRAISVFFYDGPISRAIAFEDLLADGKRFSDRLRPNSSDAHRTWPQLVHIATDGETYGHHRAYGDMALAFALHDIEAARWRA